MRTAGLEWTHRLAQEPRRLFGRYVINGLPFAAGLLTRSALQGLRKAGTARSDGMPALKPRPVMRRSAHRPATP